MQLPVVMVVTNYMWVMDENTLVFTLVPVEWQALYIELLIEMHA